MFDYVYPFAAFHICGAWLRCKPVPLIYLLYFAISCIYKRRLVKGENAKGKCAADKKTGKMSAKTAWAWTYLFIPLLYCFAPSAGWSDTWLTQIAETYLRYETLLGAAMVAALVLIVRRKLFWRYVRVLDRAVTVMIVGTVVATVLARQVDPRSPGNIIWFILLGLMCWQMWCWWEKNCPGAVADESSNRFEPVATYEKLFPQRQRVADEVLDIIRSQEADKALSICIAGKWGAGKTSVVNGVVDRLRQEDVSGPRYEVIYINAMELDTLSSLFIYVFERIRNILKKRGAYVGVGSVYRQFLASAVGKITDSSLAAVLEGWLFPASGDYRVQLKELEEYICTTLGSDKILVIVDDVERCEIEKARQFIFFIKEIATLKNCITIFLADHEYLNQCHRLSMEENGEDLTERSDIFYEKFFNWRIDISPVTLEEAMEQLELEARKVARELRFRAPSELFDVFETKLRQTAEKYREKIGTELLHGTEEKQCADADELDRIAELFRNKLSQPRSLVKFCYIFQLGCSKLRDMYTKEDTLKEGALKGLSFVRFDEILFLLAYIDVCAPHEFRCLKERRLTYLQCSTDTVSITRKLIKAMGEDLLYDSGLGFFENDKMFRYSEATRLAEAYLAADLPKEINGFSSRDEKWLYAISNNDEALMEESWPEMVQMVAQNFGWRNFERGEECLKRLFSFARTRLLGSPEGTEKIFSIFDSLQRNESLFSGHIAVMKFFFEELGSVVRGCSRKSANLLKAFSHEYFWYRASPVCRAVLYMAPAHYSADTKQGLVEKINNINEVMLSNGTPMDNLEKLLKRLCDAVPSLEIPLGDDVFQSLSALAEKEEAYMKEKKVIQYPDIQDQIHLLKISIEDMRCFTLLLQQVQEEIFQMDAFTGEIDLANIDGVIQQFKAAFSASDAAKNIRLQDAFRKLFQTIRFSNVILSAQQYKALHDILTEGEKLYSDIPYFRKVLIDHRSGDGTDPISNLND